jgi:hypothetical protein
MIDAARLELSEHRSRQKSERDCENAAVPPGGQEQNRDRASEPQGFDSVQLVAELQSAVPHARLPDVTSDNAADRFPGIAIAVLIPCHNEVATIGTVVRDFRAALPQARVAVLDNASKDDTILEARAAGAEVLPSAAAARTMSCAACLPKFLPTFTSWLTATAHTTPPQRRSSSA